MDHALAPCPGCTRHVRTHEARCPFCEARLEGAAQRVHFAAVATMAAAFLHPAEGLPQQIPLDRMNMGGVAAYGAPSRPDVTGLTIPGADMTPPPERIVRGQVVLSPPTVERGPASARGALQRTLMLSRARARACHDLMLRENPSHQASLRLRVTVGPEERVASASVVSAAQNDTFERCVLARYRITRFTGVRAGVTFSFTLRASPAR